MYIIHIANNGLNHTAVFQISEQFTHFKQLQTLDLGSSSIHIIHIGNNYFGNKGIVEINQNIGSLINLQKVNISMRYMHIVILGKNKCYEEYSKVTVEKIVKLPKITDLNFSNICIYIILYIIYG